MQGYMMAGCATAKYTYMPPSPSQPPLRPPSCLLLSKQTVETGVCRVLFWLAVALAVTLAIHMLVLAAFLFSRWSTPSLLHFPRPELLVLLVALAAIAQGAASKSAPGLVQFISCKWIML